MDATQALEIREQAESDLVKARGAVRRSERRLTQAANDRYTVFTSTNSSQGERQFIADQHAREEQFIADARAQVTRLEGVIADPESQAQSA